METLGKRRRVGYFFDEEIGMYTFKKGHPMRPFRMKITDELIKAYGMDQMMTCYDSNNYLFPDKGFEQYHSTEFGFSSDCPYPTNSRIYDLCRLYTSGSVFGAIQIASQEQDMFINWSGGLHHAKRQEASGFCYVNDCVLAILELLKYYPRVLYLDIDVHHGDGVEEAFFNSDRVMTCSFHKYKDFFPGTGHISDIGAGKGIYHSVNFPLSDGIDDMTYKSIFEPVMNMIFDTFRPSVVLMQCGGDSLSGDRLGVFNLSIHGHGACVDFIKKKGVPLIVTGGGGYTLRNIPRVWTYETSVVLGVDIDNKIPDNKYASYFYPEGLLQTQVSNMVNQNCPQELLKVTEQIMDNLKSLKIYSPELNVEDDKKYSFPKLIDDAKSQYNEKIENQSDSY